MRNLLFAAITFLLFSCGNPTADDKKIDSLFPQPQTDSSKPIENSKKDSAEENAPKTFHLSPADSAKVADSIAKTRNPIRDFN